MRLSDFVQHVKPLLGDNFHYRYSVYLFTINAVLKSIHIHQLITGNAKKKTNDITTKQQKPKKKVRNILGRTKLLF